MLYLVQAHSLFCDLPCFMDKELVTYDSVNWTAMEVRATFLSVFQQGSKVVMSEHAVTWKMQESDVAVSE